MTRGWINRLLCLGALFSAAQALATPAAQSVCTGISDTGPGGMFGYSVALSSQDQQGLTFMVSSKEPALLPLIPWR
jgi:hypothetical protein